MESPAARAESTEVAPAPRPVQRARESTEVAPAPRPRETTEIAPPPVPPPSVAAPELEEVTPLPVVLPVPGMLRDSEFSNHLQDFRDGTANASTSARDSGFGIAPVFDDSSRGSGSATSSGLDDFGSETFLRVSASPERTDTQALIAEVASEIVAAAESRRQPIETTASRAADGAREIEIDLDDQPDRPARSSLRLALYGVAAVVCVAMIVSWLMSGPNADDTQRAQLAAAAVPDAVATKPGVQSPTEPAKHETEPAAIAGTGANAIAADDATTTAEAEAEVEIDPDVEPKTAAEGTVAAETSSARASAKKTAKPSSAAPPPPPPAAAPKKKVEKAAKPEPTAASLLQQAKQASARGEGRKAHALAAASYRKQPSDEAAEIMVIGACKAGDRDKAKAALKQVPLRRRLAVRASCRERDVKL